MKYIKMISLNIIFEMSFLRDENDQRKLNYKFTKKMK